MVNLGEENCDLDQLKELLKWSARSSSSSELESNELSNEISNEDREHLFKALQEGRLDVPKRMAQIGNALSEKSTKDGDRIDLLNELEEQAEDIDTANDMPKVGALSPVIGIALGESDDASGDAIDLALGILSTYAQNNPSGQQALYDNGVLDRLVEQLNGENGSEGQSDHMSGVVTAISSAVRGHAQNGARFLELNGLKGVAHLILAEDAESNRARRKALQLARYYACNSQKGLDELAGGQRGEELIEKAAVHGGREESKDVQAREQAMGLLVDIAKRVDFRDHPSVADALRSDVVRKAAESQEDEDTEELQQSRSELLQMLS